MRVAVSKQDFQKALVLLSKATDKKSRLSFEWAKLTAEFDKHLTLQGTNGEVYLTLKAPVEVEAEGQVCVEADVLLKAVKSIKKREWIELYTKEDRLVIKAGDLIQKLALKPVEDFPEFPNPNFQASLPDFVLNEAIGKVSFAVATEKEDAMKVLKCLYIDGRGSFTNFVGSNGHKLALLKSDKYPLDIKAKLYIKSLKLLKELLKNAGQVQIGTDENFVHLSNGLWTISIKDFSDADYPDYEAVFPNQSDYDVVVVVFAEDLDNALANFVKHPKITIEFTDRDDGFRIKAQDEELGEAEVWVKADIYGIKQFSLDFIPKHIKDFTEEVGKGLIEARFKDDDGFPALFKADGSYSYLVMPLIRKKKY